MFGTGQAGNALAAHLAGLGMAARAVSRHRPAELAGGHRLAGCGCHRPSSGRRCAQGASAVYQCVSAPYTQWPERFSPLQRGVLTTAERTGARLVVLENLYGYGPTGASR